MGGSTWSGIDRARSVPALLTGSLALSVIAALCPTRSASELADPPPQTLASRIEFGAHVAQMEADSTQLDNFEKLVAQRVGVASTYHGYGDVFPASNELTFADGGARKVLTAWDMGQSRFRTWTAGRHNHYLDRLVAAFRAYPYDLYVRPWPEMNGDWQPFQPTVRGRKPAGGTWAAFRRAWRYLVTYFRDRDVTNVRWVFNPTADVYRGTTPVAKIWPGDGYVDVLGLDGFNWGKDSDWGQWRGFRDIFLVQYRRLTELSPRDPVWICEVGSKEPEENDGAPIDPHHSKATWVSRMLGTTAFRRITTLIWFQEDKERDWRINSSQAALAALRSAMPPATG